MSGYSVVVQGGSSSTGAGAGGWNYSYAALLNRTAGAPYEGLVSNMAHGNTDSLYNALLFSSMVSPGTRVVVWEFAMTDQYGTNEHGLAWRFWMHQARAHNVWVIPVILWVEPPKLPNVGGSSAAHMQTAAVREPSVLGVVDVNRLVRDRCTRRASCKRASFISDSHHPNAAVHQYIATELAAILAAHAGSALERGPDAVVGGSTSEREIGEPGEVFGLMSRLVKCKNVGVAKAIAAHMVPGGVVRTASWLGDRPMRSANEQPLLRRHGDLMSDAGPISLGKESSLRLDRQRGFAIPRCADVTPGARSHSGRARAAEPRFNRSTALSQAGANTAHFSLVVGREGRCTGGTVTGLAWRAQIGNEYVHSTRTSNEIVWTVTHALHRTGRQKAPLHMQTLRAATELCPVPSRPAFTFAPILPMDPPGLRGAHHNLQSSAHHNQSHITSLQACYNGSAVAGDTIAMRAVSLFCTKPPPQPTIQRPSPLVVAKSSRKPPPQPTIQRPSPLVVAKSSRKRHAQQTQEQQPSRPSFLARMKDVLGRDVG